MEPMPSSLPHFAARTMRTGESELKMNYAEMNAKLLSQSGIYKSPTRGSRRLFRGTWP